MLGKEIVDTIVKNKLEDFEILADFIIERKGVPDYISISLNSLGDIGRSSKVAYIEGDHIDISGVGMTGKQLIELIESNELLDLKIQIGFMTGYYPNSSYQTIILREPGEIEHEEEVAFLSGDLFL